jgi:predicted ArsR family transcriptional regulator
MAEEDYTQILRALSTRGKLNFQQVVNLGINRKTARKRLDALMARKFVTEQGERKRHSGRPLIYSLTAKGKKEALRLTLKNLNQSMMMFKDSLEAVTVMVPKVIGSSPEFMEDYRLEIEKALSPDDEASRESEEHASRESESFRKQLGAPLIRSYALMQNLLGRLGYDPLKAYEPFWVNEGA